MKAFTGIPFFRIMIPFTLGILIGVKLIVPAVSFLYVLSGFSLLLAFILFCSLTGRSKNLVLAAMDIFLLFYGLVLVQQKDARLDPLHYTSGLDPDSALTFIAAINDLPVAKQKSYKCELKLLEAKGGRSGSFHPVKGTIYAYFRQSSVSGALEAGQTLLIRARLAEVQPPKNPFEFDYQAYLYSRQIYHTAFIDSAAFSVLALPSQLNAVWAFGLQCKEALLTRLKSSGLDATAYAICAALLTGYDDEIEKPVLEAFSHTGTLHVLSVSGLHTGLIYLALNWLLSLFDPRNRYKLLRFITITLCLWLFALITGFSAPVLRAVIMFNLMGLGKIYFRAGFRHQVNILLVSAFILLVYNPLFILDIGFLLSYFALFGLLYFQPALTALWPVKNKVLNLFWQSVTTSVAATISTLPITLFCFKQFPIWFFVCNIVVIPATFVLLALAVLLVLKWSFLGAFVNLLVAWLLKFINLFSYDTFGFIDNIHFTWSDAVFLSVLILLCSLAFQYRDAKLVYATLVILVCWQVTSVFQSFTVKSRSQLAVYHVKNTHVAAVKNTASLALQPVSEAVYRFNVHPHVNSLNYIDTCKRKFNLVAAFGQYVLFLDQPGFWPDIDRKRITRLVLSNNFRLSAEDLREMTALEELVVDASNNRHTVSDAEKLSRNFGIDFYNTKYKGAYLLELQ